MAKAAMAAYPDGSKPFGYRSFSKNEWDACSAGCPELVYTQDGFFNVGSGLRGRLMVNMLNEGRVVLSLSGCDFGLEAKLAGESLKDAWNCIRHYFNATAQQYEQALRLMNGVLASKERSELWIVGHSLGGSLTTYLALHIPASRTKVKCATFNGYGVSSEVNPVEGDVALAKSRLRNVYAEEDPVYKIGKNVKHYGPSYSIKYPGGFILQHSIEELIKNMSIRESKWKGL